MSDKWLSGSSSESGILRKTKIAQHTAATDDLLIFGYAAKLFRNDEQARFMDHGKHLIPWNGDNTLKIDRYDVRATLSDLQPYEAPSGGYTNRLDYLTPAEQRAEQLCEEERYRSLYDNDVDEELYREEESKRSQASYQQISFNYDGNSATEEKEVEEPKDEETDEPFVPNPKFHIPQDIEIPQSLKLHAIIEKTARFIAGQGIQMEILIKAKQSNNPLFEFLNQNNRMNRYYKHVMNAIKSNTYPVVEENEDNEDGNSNDASTTAPAMNNAIPDVPYQPMLVPTLKYKPSADCSYTQLISKIKGVPMPLNQLDSASETGVNSNVNSPQPFDYNNERTQSPVTVTVPQPTTAILPMSQKLLLDLDHEKIKATIQSKAEGVEINKISTGLMLAQCYNSDSESDDDDGSEAKDKMPKIDFPIPHPDLQNIIDKTAAYVLKNGREFEDILRTKNDARFSFLSATDEYHRYYIYKVSGIIYPTTTTPSTLTTASSAPPPMPTKIPYASNAPKVITSVSFSIKPKDDQPIPLKPALPLEPSSDEDEANSVPSIVVPAPLEPNNRTAHSAKLSVHDIINVSIPPPTILRVNGIEPPKLLEEKLVRINHKIEMVSDVSDISIRDAMLENCISGDDKREARRAEDKFKDRLAQVAREKLGMLSKEKQLQLERKKKAMAFLNQIKGSSNQTSSVENMTLPTKATQSVTNPLPVTLENQTTASSTQNNTESDATIESVHSSPIRDGSSKLNESSDDDVQEVFSNRSRSRSRSASKREKRKKSKHRSKKKSKRRASRSRSRSSGRDRKSRKRSSSKKRRRKNRDD
ncbi:protein suppressor of white apricot isoform X2 [Bradysia coprophila]|uniref:protein suppressor of white apricot isoform X2 n=1 Tax=Bradysia coprophila TaxID=38358 RepID=UPI00187D7D70|nr:protein suppressor of white apricot isoform X2 [Bradysia coprophila]